MDRDCEGDGEGRVCLDRTGLLESLQFYCARLGGNCMQSFGDYFFGLGLRTLVKSMDFGDVSARLRPGWCFGLGRFGEPRRWGQFL